jgi:rod shape-determining protein MreB
LAVFKGFRKLFANELSIDLGTANTLIYTTEHGIILNEPSVVAIVQNANGSGSYNEVVAVGTAAKAMVGRTPKNILAIRPLKDGVIADFNATEKMLQYFIHKASKLNSTFAKRRPRLLICVPVGATQVERRAIKESALGAGAREVFLIDEPMAAALGAGMPIHQATGSMVVDIGGGTTEIAVLSLNGMVYAASAKVGGDRFDDSIVNFVRRKYGILIGETTAERIKQKIGTAYLKPEMKKISVRGRNLTEGIPRTVIITSKDVCEALQEPLAIILESIRVALESIPPELASDVGEFGIHLTGGGALLNGLDKLIQSKTGIPVVVADDPLTCVVRGGGIALEFLNQHSVDSSLLSFIE